MRVLGYGRTGKGSGSGTFGRDVYTITGAVSLTGPRRTGRSIFQTIDYKSSAKTVSIVGGGIGGGIRRNRRIDGCRVLTIEGSIRGGVSTGEIISGTGL